MANLYGPRIVTDGLVLYLDAANPKSYPGSGTDWYDLSGNNYHFTVNSSAYSRSNGVNHMNFEGSAGSAQRKVNNVLTNIPNFTNATVMVYTTILNSNTSWRTLLRGATQDHQVLIRAGTDDLGMYHSNSTSFIDSMFDIISLPNPYSQFNCLIFRLSQSSPYYQFQYNNNNTIYSITNINASFNSGFCTIGSNIDGSQPWGKIANFIYYNKQLSQAEILQNYNALKGRFNL